MAEGQAAEVATLKKGQEKMLTQMAKMLEVITTLMNGNQMGENFQVKEDMGHQLEARIDALERNQEEFGHDIRELKGQVCQLLKMVGSLVEAKGSHSHESSSQIQPCEVCIKTPDDQYKDQALEKVVERMEEFRLQMIERKSCMPKKGFQGLSQPSNSDPQENQTLCPTMNNFSQYPYPYYPFINDVAPYSCSPGPMAQPIFQQKLRPTVPTVAPRPATISASRGNNNKFQKNRKSIDPIPMTYAQLLPILFEKNLLVPVHVEPWKPPFPKWYNPDAHCAYHAGIAGHDTENCSALKFRVQNLIRTGQFGFIDESDVDTNQNSLPNHGGSTLGMEVSKRKLRD